MFERGGQRQGERRLVVRGTGADGRAQRRRLDEQARAETFAQPGVARGGVAATMQAIGHHGQAGLQQQALGHLLVHRRRAREHARADVGHAAGLEQPLQAAVLAERAMQGGQRDVDARQLAGDVRRLAGHQLAAAPGHQRDRAGGRVDETREGPAGQRHVAPRAASLDADGHHPVARIEQGGVQRGRGAQRHLVLGGAAAEEQADGDGGGGGRRVAREFERNLGGMQVASFVVVRPVPQRAVCPGR